MLQFQFSTPDKEPEEFQMAHDDGAITSTRLVPLSQPEQGGGLLGGETPLRKQILFGQSGICYYFEAA
jgi:hypothetical protein